MKKHFIRPLLVVAALVMVATVARFYFVPDDFGLHGRNFTYGYYRRSNVEEWENFPVKYQGKEYCNQCHKDKVEENLSSPHRIIQCENCHGPAREHPDNPERLIIDTSRDLCLRCHAHLPYPENIRNTMKSIADREHNPGELCVSCHNPHNPNLEEM